MAVKIGIIGGAGYTGGELIRLLINHPQAEISFINSSSNAGNNVSKVHADLVGETDLKFSSELSEDIDVLFLCVGHGDAKKFLEANAINEKIKIIDLSQDFRLSSISSFKSPVTGNQKPVTRKNVVSAAAKDGSRYSAPAW